MKCTLSMICMILAIATIFTMQSCQDSEAPKKKVESTEKAEKKKKRRHKDHIDVDMVARTLNFVKRNVHITDDQEQQIIELTSEYNFDSLTREEFYFRRLELRDRIFKEVLSESQRGQIKK